MEFIRHFAKKYSDMDVKQLEEMYEEANTKERSMIVTILSQNPTNSGDSFLGAQLLNRGDLAQITKELSIRNSTSDTIFEAIHSLLKRSSFDPSIFQLFTRFNPEQEQTTGEIINQHYQSYPDNIRIKVPPKYQKTSIELVDELFERPFTSDFRKDIDNILALLDQIEFDMVRVDKVNQTIARCIQSIDHENYPYRLEMIQILSRLPGSDLEVFNYTKRKILTKLDEIQDKAKLNRIENKDQYVLNQSAEHIPPLLLPFSKVMIRNQNPQIMEYIFSLLHEHWAAPMLSGIFSRLSEIDLNRDSVLLILRYIGSLEKKIETLELDNLRGNKLVEKKGRLNDTIVTPLLSLIKQVQDLNLALEIGEIISTNMTSASQQILLRILFKQSNSRITLEAMPDKNLKPQAISLKNRLLTQLKHSDSSVQSSLFDH